jgi:hypothetical protein
VSTCATSEAGNPPVDGVWSDKRTYLGRYITATGEGNHIDGILVISAGHWTPPQVDALAARLRNVEREPLDL